jgi:hypothetical protein
MGVCADLGAGLSLGLPLLGALALYHHLALGLLASCLLSLKLAPLCQYLPRMVQTHLPLQIRQQPGQQRVVMQDMFEMRTCSFAASARSRSSSKCRRARCSA